MKVHRVHGLAHNRNIEMTSSTIGASITPSDTVQITTAHSKVYVGGAGNLAVTLSGGDAVTFIAVPVGTTLDITCSLIKSTSTTATNILVLG